VIGTEPSARVHEIRDLLTRNSVPFGFQRADSEEGSAALQRLGLDPSCGPVVAFHTGVVLADPANTDVRSRSADGAAVALASPSPGLFPPGTGDT
jgi:thioredoxin reductase (NADPH)